MDRIHPRERKAPFLMKNADPFTSRALADARRYYIAKVVGASAGFATIPLLTRLLGLDGYGVYGLVLAWALLSAQLCTGWLQQAILRFAPRSAGFSYRFLRPVKGFAFFAVGGAMLVSVLLGVVRGTAAWGVTGAAAMVSGAFALFTVTFALAQGRRFATYAATADALRLVIPGIIYLGLLVLAVDPIRVSSALLITALGAVAGSIMAAASFRRSQPGVGVKDTLPTHDVPDVDVRSILTFGVPMGIWLALAASYPALARLAVSIESPETLGMFVAYQDVAIKLGTLSLMPLTLSAHATIMAMDAEIGRAIRVLSSLMRYALVAGLLLLIVGSASTPVIDMILGVEPAPLRLILVMLLLSEVLGQLALLAHKILELRSRPRLMVVAMFVSLTVALVTYLASRSLFAPDISAALALLGGRSAYLGVVALLSWRVLAGGELSKHKAEQRPKAMEPPRFQ